MSELCRQSYDLICHHEPSTQPISQASLYQSNISPQDFLHQVKRDSSVYNQMERQTMFAIFAVGK